MSLIKRNGGGYFPLRSLMSDFFDNDGFVFDKMLNNETLPAVNISENEKNYEIELAVPGMKKEDFKVKVENGVLTIAAEKREEKEEKRKNFTRQEYNYSSFRRSFTLPENAKEDNLQAHYDNGLLKLTVAKKVATPAKVKEIPVV